MEYFNFRNDSIANLVFDRLAVKANEGVEVRLLFDAFGNSSNNKPLKRQHLEKIRQSGIEIFEFDPIKFPWINHVLSRDHRKIVIIDGRTAYTGGMNIADYYIHGTEVVGEWHDMHCRIEGAEVETLQAIFLNMWYEVTGQILTDSKYYPTENYTPIREGAMVGIINREPRKTPRIIRQFYIDAINAANDSIKIVNPYFTLSSKLKKSLRKAAERGVKVEIMLSTKSDIPLTPDCGFYNAHKLMKHGCDIWMYERGFHHTKVIMVDGKFCTVGSANLNARSLRFDYEANAVIVDSTITNQLSDLFTSQKSDSFLLTPETWRSFRTPWQRVRGFLAHLLTPFL